MYLLNILLSANMFTTCPPTMGLKQQPNKGVFPSTVSPSEKALSSSSRGSLTLPCGIPFFFRFFFFSITTACPPPCFWRLQNRGRRRRAAGGGGRQASPDTRHRDGNRAADASEGELKPRLWRGLAQ